MRSILVLLRPGIMTPIGSFYWYSQVPGWEYGKHEATRRAISSLTFVKAAPAALRHDGVGLIVRPVSSFGAFAWIQCAKTSPRQTRVAREGRCWIATAPGERHLRLRLDNVLTRAASTKFLARTTTRQRPPIQ